MENTNIENIIRKDLCLNPAVFDTKTMTRFLNNETSRQNVMEKICEEHLNYKEG